MIAVVEATAGVFAKEPPNPILPVWNEIVWTVIAVVLLYLLLRVAFPKVANPLDRRSEQIRADLAAAEQARVEAEQVQARYRQQISEARAEAGRIIDEARRAFEAERSEVLARVNAELAEQRQQAAAEIEAAKAQALDGLRPMVADLTADAAARVLGRPVPVEVAQRAVSGVLAGGAA